MAVSNPMGRSAPTGQYWSRCSEELLGTNRTGTEVLILMSAAYGVHAIETQSRTLDLVVNGKRRSYTPDVLVTWQKSFNYPHARASGWFEVKTREDLRRGVKEYGPLFKQHAQSWQRRALASSGDERTFTAAKLAMPRNDKRHRKVPDDALYVAARSAFMKSSGPLKLKRLPML